MRVHLVGMPHLDPVRANEPCAFSQKHRRLCDMLTSRGIEVFWYGGPHLEAAVAEHVTVVHDSDRARWFGGETWAEKVFDHWDPAEPCWAQMNQAAICEMRGRVEPGDIIGLTMGRCQQAVADAFPGHVRAEVGIGYTGVLTATHWCVESEAWRHFLYGRNGIDNGRWFDTVIPNSFDPDDYEVRAVKDDYLLFLGRMTSRKGLDVVTELAKHHRVVTAGQGDERAPGAEHVGVVRGDDKKKLLAGAQALLCPTVYVEPFGGVAVEAMMSGTPVLSSPWGAFSETVRHGDNGYRCSTLREWLDAVEAVRAKHDGWRHKLAVTARHRYSTGVVAQQYDTWLRKLASLYHEGWYS